MYINTFWEMRNLINISCWMSAQFFFHGSHVVVKPSRRRETISLWIVRLSSCQKLALNITCEWQIPTITTESEIPNNRPNYTHSNIKNRKSCLWPNYWFFVCYCCSFLIRSKNKRVNNKRTTITMTSSR